MGGRKIGKAIPTKKGFAGNLIRNPQKQPTKMSNSTTDNNNSNIPTIGEYYSCAGTILKLTHEDEYFYFFCDGRKYPKSIPFSWPQAEAPAEAVVGEQKEHVWSYESYSHWPKYLAASTTIEELQKEVNRCEVLHEKYAKSHLAAIKKSTSMQSNSQRRAQSRNNVTANAEKKNAYLQAIEIHKHYPQFSKK